MNGFGSSLAKNEKARESCGPLTPLLVLAIRLQNPQRNFQPTRGYVTNTSPKISL